MNDTIDSFDFSPAEIYGLTGGLTAGERGTVFVLLTLLWFAQETDCSLADDANLPSALETTPKKWNVLKKRLLGTPMLATEGDGWIYSPWLRDKLQLARVYRERARKGGLAKSAKQKQAAENPASLCLSRNKQEQAESAPPVQEKAPQTPKENIYPESKPRTPQPPTGEAGADGSLLAYPETAAALAAYPADLTQAQMLELTRIAAKRGDAVTAAITRASADRCRAPASDVRSPAGFLLYELKTRKEVPNARPKCPERYRNLIPDNERTDAPN